MSKRRPGVDTTKRQPTEAEMAERHRLETLVAEVGVALSGAESLRQGLQQCAEILVRNIDAAFARIWTVNQEDKVLELQASAGIYTHLDGGHARVPIGQFKIGRIAENGEPHLTNTVQQDSWVRDPEWARREGMVAFAGYPLKVEERVLGVVAAFARQPLTPATLQAFASVAHNLAQFIQRKQAEEALRESEEKYRALIETTGTGYVIIDTQGRVIDANPEYVRLTGRRALQEILGRRVTEWTAQHDLARNAEAVRKCAELGFVRNLEIEYVNRDGECIPVEVNATVVPGAGGVRIVSLCRDITERKRAEEALRRSEARLKEALLAAQMGVWEWTVETDTVTWDENLYRIAGRDLKLPAPSYQEHPQDYAPEIWEREKAAVENALATGTPYELDMELVRPDGSKRWVVVHGEPRRDASGRTTGLRGTVQDITERKLTEQALRDSEQRYRDFIEHSTEGVWRLELEQPIPIDLPEDEILERAILSGYLAECNLAFARTLGLSTPEEVVGRHLRDLFPPSDKARWEPFRSTARGELMGRTVEVESRDKSGNLRHWLRTEVPIIQNGMLTRVWGITRDITEQRAAEKAALEAESEYRKIFEGAMEGIYRTSLEGKSLAANPALARMLGYDSAQEVVSAITDSAHQVWLDPNERSRFIALLQEQGPARGFECQYKRKDGTVIWVSLNSRLVYGVDGRPLHTEGFIEDITERKRAEEALRESEERFRATIENAPFGYYRVGKDGLWQYVNPVWERMHGLSSEEAIGKPFEITQPSDSVGEARELVKRALAGETIVGEFGRLTREGNTEYHSFNIQPVKDCTEIVGIEGFINDITERKRAEEALRESEEKHRTLFETMAQGVVYQNAEGQIISANPAAERLLGLTLAQMLGRTSVDPRWKAIHEDGSDFPGDTHPAMIALRTGKEVSGVVMGVFRPGANEYVWINIHAVPQFRPGETKPYQVYTTFDDITERKRAEEALRQSEENFEALAESASEGILIATGEEGRHVYANRRAVEITGYPIEELLKTCVRDLAHPEELAKIAERYKERLEGVEVPTHYETAFLNKDGVKVLIEISPSRTVWQNQLADMVMFRDITERKRAEDALRQSEAYLAEGQRLSHTGSSAFDLASNKYIYASEEVFRIFEIDAQEGLPNREAISRLIHPEDWDSVNASFEKLLREKVDTSSEFRIVLPSGTVKHLQTVRHPVMNDAGHVVKLIGTVLDLTERKRAEEALRESEERFRSLVENATVGIYRTTPDGHILMANPALVRMLGFDSFEELAARNLECEGFESSYPRSLFRERIGREGQVIGLEAAWIRHDGSVIFVRESARAVRADDGRVLYYDGIVEDITTRRRAEEAVRRASAYNRSLIEASLDPLVTIAPDGKITDVNNATEKVTGLSRQQLIGTDFSDYFTDSGKARAGYEQVFREGLVQDYGLEIRHRDGHVTPVLYNAAVYRDEAGDVIGVFAAARDITERKQAEEALRQSEQRFRRLSEATFEAIVIHDKGKILDVNQTFARMFGCEIPEAIGKNALDFTAPESRDLVLKNALSLHENPYEAVALRKDGSAFAAELCAKPLPYGGRMVRVVAMRDITERKRAEQELHESEERYRSLVEAAPDVIYTVSAEDGSLTSLNPAFETLTGWSRAEWLGKPFLGMVHPDDLPVAVERFQKALRGETHPPHELRVLCKSGEYLVGEFTSTPHVKDGKVVAQLGIARDITERKRAEEALRESEERFRGFVEKAPIGIYRTAPDGGVLMANPTVVRMLGYDSFQELASRNLDSEGFEPSYPRSAFRERVERDGEVKDLENVWMRRDGSPIVVRESARVVRANAGRVLYYEGVVEDVTERRRAEESMRQLSGRLLRLQDEERRRIARQLHDTAAQDLAGLAINLNMVKDSAGHLSPRARACLSESLELAEQCSREIRTLSYLLHPPLVDEAGLAPALRWYTAGFGQRGGIEVHAEVSPEFGRLPSEFEWTLYRVVQEALTNIHRHSGSKTARICLERRPNEIVLTVADEGHGFPSAALGIAGPESADLGVGIPGMRERLRQLGGRLHIQSGRRGTTLTAILPLRQVTNGQTTLPFGG